LKTRRRFMKALTFSVATGLLGCGRTSKNDMTDCPVGRTVGHVSKDEKVSPSAFTTVGITLDGQPVDVDVPLLNRAHECDIEIDVVRGGRPERESGFSYLGLNLESSPLQRAVYWCTPINSIVFGGNGGDGFHFSFVVTGNELTPLRRLSDRPPTAIRPETLIWRT
jgi:hypothetical protein